MNKTTKVILLSALTTALGFVGCGGGEDIENQAIAGAPAGAGMPATTSIAGATSTAAGAPTITPSIGSSTAFAPPTAHSASNSGGCNVRQRATSRGALTGRALALALAFAARRRRS
ncbi:MAG TPA: hypothetical protein VHW01_14440 [Polyangiaceae bacterium]|jgi:hypothetical protein|nr:hypothetical protein [Polyangiaceae bacterium]